MVIFEFIFQLCKNQSERRHKICTEHSYYAFLNLLIVIWHFRVFLVSFVFVILIGKNKKKKLSIFKLFKKKTISRSNFDENYTVSNRVGTTELRSESFFVMYRYKLNKMFYVSYNPNFPPITAVTHPSLVGRRNGEKTGMEYNI